MKKMIALLALVPVLLLTQGCFISVDDNDPGPTPGITGDLKVRWTFDGVPACPADVEDVVVRVSFLNGRAALDDRRVSCVNGQALISSMEPGKYLVKVMGLFDGQVTWESGEREVRVVSDNVVVLDADLLR